MGRALPKGMDLLSRPTSSCDRVLPVGAAIGSDLTVTGVLGEGGTGIVYAAYHDLLRRHVAVKMSRMGGMHATEGRARLVREAQMCASVRSAHLPRIYGLDVLPDGTPYIVMEKLQGEPLTQVMVQQQISVRDACLIVRQLLTALSAVHKKGIVHRDVKPGNVLIDLDHPAGPKVWLLDLGVGKVLHAAELDQPDLTCQGELLGTPLYMAPEQVLGQPVDARADLYAAGVVLYELLAGRTPFVASSVGEVFAAVLRDEITPLSELCPSLPEPLIALTQKACSKQPEARFQTALEMRSAVEQVIAVLGEEPSMVRLPRARPDRDDPDLTLVYKPEARTAIERDAHAARRRSLSLSLARTVKVRPAELESGTKRRFGFRPRRDALAFERTLVG
jgi:serine/threonine protein kinase